MLGIDDPWILGGYLACLASTVLCVAYGLIFWNRGAEAPQPQEAQWEQREQQDKSEQ